MVLRKSVVLLVLVLAVLTAGCAPTCYGRLDRPTPSDDACFQSGGQVAALACLSTGGD